jgi:transglutaminase-like putative cysteine protease
MRLDIRYRCCFEYGELVRESQNELRACPVTDDHQSLLTYRVATSPSAKVASFDDYWGTRVDTFGIREPHVLLEVIAEATVETRSSPLLLASPQLDRLRDEPFASEHLEYLERTRHVDWNGRVTAEAASQVELFGPDLVSVVLGIHRRVHSLVRYTPGSTYVGVGIDEVLDRGEGVCQDYAHLAIAICRAAGIPARYVSGYLFTSNDAAGTLPALDGTGGDAVSVQTHAWFEAAIPGHGWLALDPTNQQEVGLRHVKIGHGRDYDDVPPLRGTYAGKPGGRPQVAVEMRRSTLADIQAQQQQAQ